ncbi:MAG: ATP binding [Piccolia ochrophora]|nr:MAG: ATP binding [Piccolia ochrophora]
MAMVAPKLPTYSGAREITSGQQSGSSLHTTSAPNQRARQPINSSHGVFASPTESEFSDVHDELESVRSWDEKRVGEWLKVINCGQYESLFKANHFNGDNLLECDQAVLKELGIKKIGDRVRIFVAIKGLRNAAYAKQRRRNRDSFAALESTAFTPSSSGSPRTHDSTRNRTQGAAKSKRYSQVVSDSTMAGYNPPTAVPMNLGKLPSRPSSPLAFDSEGRPLRTPRFNTMSPMETARRDQNQGYFTNSNPSSAHTVSGMRPGTPGDASQPARAPPHKQQPSIDGSFIGPLPSKMECVRVIYAGGETKVVKVTGAKTSEDIIRLTLRKFGLREDHVKNFCFYVLDGTDPDPGNCRRLSEMELVRICSDRLRAERNRLILRKVHAGEPGDEELQRAARIAAEETAANQMANRGNSSTRSQAKVAKLIGESWDGIGQSPLSPASFDSSRSGRSAAERDRHVHSAARNLERPEEEESPQPQQRDRGFIHRFFGQRPPSELISSDLAAYFPAHQKEDIEKTVRMSMRRSARLSRATSRLSTASNLSYTSSLKDAPPIPSIAETWLTGGNQPAKPARPLSITRFGLPQTSYRDSVASSALEPLQEESPSEPDRKSYVSFDSGSDMASASVNDHAGSNALQSYFDEASSPPGTDPGRSINEIERESLKQALAEDGEEQDEELDQYLADNSWDNIKWMKGALIGQGSFGSVYLALNAITGELMAAKQVEMPSDSGTQMDNKKRGMVEALKREIGLLRSLSHPNIVQYLGAGSDEEHLNIFLEYVPGGSIAAMLNSYGPLREPLIRNFVRQILTGLNYLHGRDIIHRDIKGANVLVDNKGGIKISDFGISKRVEASSLLKSGAAGHHNRPSLQGSVFWMAPEVVKQTSYTRKADIWSLGCLIVEMFTGTHPYPDCSQLQAIFKIGNGKASPTLPEHGTDEAKTFLDQTFELDHNKRPNAADLLVSPFLNPMA